MQVHNLSKKLICIENSPPSLPVMLRGLRTNGRELFLLLFVFLNFICHTIITKNIGKEEKKKWRGDLTETIRAYERLGLFEL